MRPWPTLFLLCALVVACTRPDVTDPLDAPIVLEQPPTVAVDWRTVGPIDFDFVPWEGTPYRCGTSYYRDHDDWSHILVGSVLLSDADMLQILSGVKFPTIPPSPSADKLPSLNDPPAPADTLPVLSPLPEALDTLPTP